MFGEYDFILNKILNKPDIYKEVADVFSHRKYQGLMFFYSKLYEEFKPQFLVLFKETFLKDMKNGHLFFDRFSPSEKNKIQKVMDNPIDYFINDYLLRKKKKIIDTNNSLYRKLLLSLLEDGFTCTLNKVFRYFIK